MATDFDNWLRELNADTIVREVDELRAEQRRIDLEIRKREQALDLLKQWLPADERPEILAAPPVVRPDESRFPVPDEPPLEREETAEMDSGPPEGFEVIHDMDQKESILLDLLRAAGPEGMHLKDIRRVLAQRKLHFEGTPARGVLWRLRQTGVLESPRQGVYRFGQPLEGWDPEATQVRQG